MTAKQRKALEALYQQSEVNGDFRLRPQPEATEAREIHEAQCKTILSVLQRAGIATSITADEIDFGVLNPPDNEHGPVRAFFYFRDEAATQSIVEEKAGDYREPEDSDSARDLAALKQTIRNGGLPVSTYDAKWDATARRLTDLRKFGSRVLRDLYRSIRSDPDLATRFASKVDSEADPFVRECQDEADQMDAFIEERTERFIPGSRQPLLKSLETFAAGDDAESIFVLTGEPGSGKSALLAKFCRSLTDQPSEFHNLSFIIPHFVGASTGSTDLRRTLRRLCYELGKIVGSTEPPPFEIKELTTHFQNLLAREVAQKSGPLSPLSNSSQTAQGTEQATIVLVIDALNQLDETDGAHWLNWLPPTLPPHVRIVASIITPAAGQIEHRTLSILRNRKDAQVVNMGPLDESDALAIIESFRKRYRKRLSPGQITALLDKEKPERFLPLFLLTALEELRTLGTDEQLTTLAPDLFSPEELARLRRDDHDQILTTFIEKVLPSTARELFQWILVNRLSTDPILASHPHGGAAGLVGKFAACLGVSRHGLSPAELTSLLAPGDPLGNVAALLRLLRPYLMRRGELLDFYHGQFREAAVMEYLPEERFQEAHRLLACYFEDVGHIQARARLEAPWHRLLGDDEQGLLKLLTDHDWLAAWLSTDVNHQDLPHWMRWIMKRLDYKTALSYALLNWRDKDARALCEPSFLLLLGTTLGGTMTKQGHAAAAEVLTLAAERANVVWGHSSEIWATLAWIHARWGFAKSAKHAMEMASSSGPGDVQTPFSKFRVQ